MSSPRLYLLITTHTPLHLERVLLGVRNSSVLPRETAISCDNDNQDIVAAAEAGLAGARLRCSMVMRAHTGECRVAQVINNGLRHFAQLAGERAIRESDRVVVIQGDCCPGRMFLETHMRLGEQADLVVGFRHDITQVQSERFSDADLLAGRDPVGLDVEQVQALHTRHRRLQRQAFLRRLGLTKRHKPKVLGANFSVRHGAWLAINGMDEEYVGYGSEDDDLGRRLVANGATAAVGVKQLEIYHLWHQTRKPGNWEDSSGVARFRLKTPTVALYGINNPLPQPPVRVSEVGTGD